MHRDDVSGSLPRMVAVGYHYHGRANRSSLAAPVPPQGECTRRCARVLGAPGGRVAPDLLRVVPPPTRRSYGGRTGPKPSPPVDSVRGIPSVFPVARSCLAPVLAGRPVLGEPLWPSGRYRHWHTLAQSSRKARNPTSVYGCWTIFCSTENGMVATSAPARAAWMTCWGCRRLAASTSVAMP